MSYLYLSPIEKDALKEIGNIGAGNAVTALSKLIDKKIDMKIPIVSLMPFNNVTSIIGSEEDLVSGLYFRMEGDIEGNILFIFSQNDAVNLLSIIFNQDFNNKCELTEMEESALKEIGNILAGSYVASLSDFTGLNIKCSVPSLSIDMAGAILSVPLVLYGQMGDDALLIETRFIENTKEVIGYFFLIPDPDSFEKLLITLGVKANE